MENYFVFSFSVASSVPTHNIIYFKVEICSWSVENTSFVKSNTHSRPREHNSKYQMVVYINIVKRVLHGIIPTY